MTKMYIANASSQVLQFNYWIPEGQRHFTHEVPIGGQVMVASKDLTRPTIDSILEQHRIYGLRTVQEALSGKLPFYGTAYQLDKPISLSHLNEMVNRYRGILSDRGRQLRQDAAIATNEYIDQQMFREQVPGRLDQLEMSVEEVDRDQRDESPEVSEGVRVTRDLATEGRRRAAPRNRRQRL